MQIECLPLGNKLIRQTVLPRNQPDLYPVESTLHVSSKGQFFNPS